MNTHLNMKLHKTKGMLITFCGLDGCGKSTMIQMLHEDLIREGCEVLLTKQPSDRMRQTDIFRTYMDSPDHSDYDYRSLSLLAASDRIQHTNMQIYPHMKQGDVVITDRYFYSCLANRIQHVNQEILPALQKGKTVICDRYFYSCLANLRARGYENDKWIYEIAKNIVKPDAAFFLDVPVSVAIWRVRSRPKERDRYIDINLQERLHQEYRELASNNQGFLIPSYDNVEGTYEKISNFVRRIRNEKQKNGN